MFIAALFTIAKRQKYLRCPSTDLQINKMWYIHTMEYCLATKRNEGTSLVAQWLRIHLPMQWTRVRALVREDPTCHGATKPVHHNY